MFNEFKEFAMKGNVMDMAIGIIIGAAFGKIISSLVDDILMPIIGSISGGVSFEELSITVGNAVITYGAFIQSVVDFLIIAFCIFVIVRKINAMKKKEEEAPSEPPRQEVLLEEIRDALRN